MEVLPVKSTLRKLVATCVVALVATSTAGTAVAEEPPAGGESTASVRLDPRYEVGGAIPDRFVGISFEWSLAERYMNPNARTAFANLLRNLDDGMIRIGGGSQDDMPYSADEPNTNRIITDEDLGYVRATMDAINAGASTKSTPPWGIVLGTAMAPNTKKPYASTDNTHRFVQGVSSAFAGDERTVAGIGLGNEPDLNYPDFNAYLDDLKTYSSSDVTGDFPVVAPSTSEDILPWQDLADTDNPSRWFWNWPKILDDFAPTAKSRAGAYGAWVSDHYYPIARDCVGRPYRCPSIPVLLGKEHQQGLDYQVYTHAKQAAAHRIGYRMEETNTAAHQGAPGVSDVAASATYAMDMMFHVACPQPPDRPGANANCATGGIGVNLHNCARNGNFNPEAGNAYYNPINFDASDTMGAPSAAPEYYALLFFSHFAQGTNGLRPVAVDSQDPSHLAAWRVQSDDGERRLFLINKGDSPVNVDVSAAASHALVDRMTPLDATGAGKTLDAPAMTVDGRQVSADGTWPGFAPTTQTLHGGHAKLSLAPGETMVVRAGGDQ